MIESPSRTAIFESAPPPPYTDEAEKEPPVADADADAEPVDVEVTVIEHKPITASIRTTIGLLHRVGGFRARWRGVGLRIVYGFLHCAITNFLSHFLGLGLVGGMLTYIFVSLGLARVHMAWTHSMIAYQSSKWWFHRLPPRKDCKVLLLPALVYAAAQQATHILPLGVGFALGVIGPGAHEAREAAGECPKQLLLLTLSFLAVPLTYILVGLAILFPASVTLTRIEATLLPEDMEPIVPFDKAAITGDIDVSVRGGCRAIFVQAWRSFDRASRWRLVKLYVKMVLAQIMVAIVTVHLMVAELYVLGAERMAVFFKSAGAQLKLMVIEAHRARMEGN